MKKIGILGMMMILSQIVQAGSYAVFGDSLSDTGNLAKFTYNSGKLYNEHLAKYFGEEFPEPNGGISTLYKSIGNATPNSLIGPNWAQGGAVANSDWGLSNSGLAGSIKLQTAKQIKKFLATNRNPEELENHRIVFLIGGNDLRIAFENNNYSNKTIMDKSIQDVGKQASELAKAGIKFLIIPKVPDISYTPKFLKTFGKVEELDKKTLYVEPRGYFSRSGGLSEDEYEKIMDEIIYEDGDTHEVIIKKAIKEILKKQEKDSSDTIVDSWYSLYLEKKQELSELTRYFNDGVDRELLDLEEKNPNLAIMRPDISLMFTEAVKNPELYGFTNAVGTAAKSLSTAITPSFHNLFGRGSGRDRIAAFDPEDGVSGKAGADKKHLWNKNRHYLFADEFHPSPELHKISADYMLSILENDQEDIYDKSVVLKENIPKDQTHILNLKDSSERVVREDSELIERGYTHFGAIRVRNSSELTWDGLNLKNVGTAISIDGENSSATISNYKINNTGMITSTVEVTDGAYLQLNNGKIDIERGSKITYPFGVRVNGENTRFKLINSQLNLKGKGATAITSGNGATIELVSSKITTENGVGLNLWRTNAKLNDTLVKSDKTGVHIFSNENTENRTTLTVENGKIEAKEYAIKVSPNISRYIVNADININESQILGGVHTGDNSFSNLSFVNSKWENNKNSNITNLSLQKSEVVFSQGDKFNTIRVENEYISNDGKFYMKGNLGENSVGDMFVVNGNVNGTTVIDFENIDKKNKEVAESSEEVGEALKLVNLTSTSKSNQFLLANPVYTEDAEYVLFGNREIYLTSTLVEKDGKFVVPIDKTFVGRKIRLERPKKVFLDHYQKINMKSSVENIFHAKDRSGIMLAATQEKGKVNTKDKEIEIDSSSLKFSYPFNDKTGIFFSSGINSSKFYDLNRVHFGKDKYIGSLKRKDYVVGAYYQSQFYKNLKLDNILEYQYIENKYNVEGKEHKNNGQALSYSTLAWINIPLSETLSVEPQYQLYGVSQKLKGYSSKYEIGNSVGGSLKWKKEKISLELGIEKKWKLKDNLEESYKSEGFDKYIRGEYRPLESVKMYAEMKRKNTSRSNLYEFGVSYKF